MDTKTVTALNNLNEQFYSSVAKDFDATRQYAWAGWERVTASLIERCPDTLVNLLDIGCGNGRLLEFLHSKNLVGSYIGVDNNSTLLDIARESISFENAEFLDIDIVADGFDEIETKGVDVAVAFGVLHHVPGYENRLQLLRFMLESVKPDGLVAVSFWQFADKKRFKDKLVPWNEHLKLMDIDSDQLEEGDFLLSWGDTDAVRYCHHAYDAEIKQILTELDAVVVDDFYSDGKSENLNRYLLFKTV